MQRPEGIGSYFLNLLIPSTLVYDVRFPWGNRELNRFIGLRILQVEI